MLRGSAALESAPRVVLSWTDDRAASKRGCLICRPLTSSVLPAPERNACKRAGARAMGVSSLHTYVEAAQLGKPLTISRGDESSQPRVVIVDVCALMLNLYGMQSLLADFGAMRDKVERMVESFAAHGVEIVAVIDGAVPPEKVATWLARRKQDAKTVVKINEAMRSPPEKARKLGKPKPSWLPPAFSQSYLGQAFRAAGCRVVFTTIEADRVAAGIATELHALGVLGHDSDFFICASRLRLRSPLSLRY